MTQNLYKNIPFELPEELVEHLAGREDLRIERMVSDGHASPEGFWYDQKEHEWVLLAAGAAVLSIEKEGGIERVELHPGDYLMIPAHQRHRVESTSRTEKTIWLAVFYGTG